MRKSSLHRLLVWDANGVLVCRSSPGAASQPYTLNTAFPTKALTDEELTIEQAGLANSVIVQRWI